MTKTTRSVSFKKVHYYILTINVSVVYIVMILMRENPYRGPLEGLGPENQDLFGP
jgi:hypothetical protein